RLDEDSNYCFGEGGAGTFSDGKLFTRSKKRGDYRKMLEILHMHGASDEILFDTHPHIGTDKLPRIIAAIRETIKSAGGIVLTGKRVSSLIVERGDARGVVTADGDRIDGEAVVLATGHSARDIYRMLHRQGIALEAKPFAMGVRVEHPQELIDRIQYKMPSRGDWLPAASYSLVAQAAGRGVYSFCMCPGGFIVPASTAEGESVVNGMSPSGRNSRYANSGIVTEIRLEDTAPYMERYGVLAGLHYQAELERLAHEAASGGVTAPAQRLTDFVAGRPSQSLPASSFNPGIVATDMKSWMPETIYRPLTEGFKAFDRKMRGFITGDAVVVGVESRTSSPVRIPRDADTLEHPAVKGLFPAGEGAGYAGGILSAAMDGERIADAVANCLKRR
ncbi:MAG: FAD-dependent oxidoreductase, partial [Rikenellaceae bacterium]|nr:FAD-dependent oxidoreductase [Rikenellaceae bacterium]